MNASARQRPISWFVVLLLLIGTIPGGIALAQEKESALSLKSILVSDAPTIDGGGNDAAWRNAPPLEAVAREAEAPNTDKEGTNVLLKSVHTSTHVYFLVSWPDKTEDVTHKTWVWNATEKAYQQGEDREDVVALAFAHTGKFNSNMLSGVEGIWDVWHWKAARTGIAGYAMDKTHHYTQAKPDGKAKDFHYKQDDDIIWIARPEDAGESVEKKQPAPTEFARQRVPQYVTGSPSGSAADIQARGVWNDGLWTVEFGRKLSTGYKDDTALAPGSTTKMSVAIFDREEDIDHSVLGVIDLTLTD